MTISDKKSFNDQFKGFINMPNLFLNSKVFSTSSFETQDILDIDFNSIDFEQLKKHKYLGKRAEYFIKTYLDQNKNYSPIYHSLQIQDNKTTLGELDFLFFDHQKNKWIHLELICKFYVFIGDEKKTDLEAWIGPNLKDRLDYKVEKLKTHQLQICQRPEAQKLLNKLNIDWTRVETQICYKAKLFLPPDIETFQFNQLNSNCLKGRYYNFEDFKNFKFSDQLYYVPQKHEWICEPKTNSQWYDFDKAQRLLKLKLQDKRAQMIWRKTKTGEFFEDFVVWW
ncbi:DUF1853 family protein [Flavobacteriaceae bacterium 14752]|uniref:DUF1853 family protein n=1 Tax=Mesohalobacter salilacus TaxID=2491711 RepID=UPI000F644869|nr:DUF1853 family protein [Flavobacteriaceae bacterium 14752]